MGHPSIGLGFDAHRFDPTGERPLWLACLSWNDGTPGLLGDSDGDAAAHALIDAILSSADLGDIGTLFGLGAQAPGAGMHGAAMLAKTMDCLHEHGRRLLNASLVIVGQRPRISSRRHLAQQAMSQAVGAPVRLTATTTDGMGFTGHDEGIAVMATALVD